MRYSALICAASQLQFAEIPVKVMDLVVLALMASIIHSVKLKLRS